MDPLNFKDLDEPFVWHHSSAMYPTTFLGLNFYHWGICYQQGLPCLVLTSL